MKILLIILCLLIPVQAFAASEIIWQDGSPTYIDKTQTVIKWIDGSPTFEWGEYTTSGESTIKVGGVVNPAKVGGVSNIGKVGGITF
jgi:hypothetical protein